MSEKDAIQGLWIGSRLPVMQRLSIRSFLAHGHSYHLYAYDDLPGVPHGAELRDASQILPASAVFRNANYDTYAIFADKFRYKLLLERGGWWVDTDMVCLRPFVFSDDYVFSSEHRILDGVVKEVATITVMKGPKHSPFLEELYTSCLKIESPQLEWNELGSSLLGKLISQHSLHAFVRRATTFCPIPMSLYASVLDSRIQFIFESSTYGVHLWHEFWRRNQLSVDADFERDCLYEQFKQYFLDGCEVTSHRAFKVG